MTVINRCFDSKINAVKSANPMAGWLVDMANQSSVPDVIRAFHERANSGIYEREDAERAAAEAAGRSRGGGGMGMGMGGRGLFSLQGLQANLPMMSGGGGDAKTRGGAD
jgi:hypothetical protein